MIINKVICDFCKDEKKESIYKFMIPKYRCVEVKGGKEKQLSIEIDKKIILTEVDCCEDCAQDIANFFFNSSNNFINRKFIKMEDN